MVCARALPSLVLRAVALFVLGAWTFVAQAQTAFAGDGYWERMPVRHPDGKRFARGNVRAGTGGEYELSGRRITGRERTVMGDGSVMGNYGQTDEIVDFAADWSLPPERIEAGGVLSLNVMLQAQRVRGRLPVSKPMFAWLEGVGNNRKNAQRRFELKGPAGRPLQRRGTLRWRVPNGPDAQGRGFVLVIAAASKSFTQAAIPAVYAYRWVEDGPWDYDFIDANPRYWNDRPVEQLRAEELGNSRHVRRGCSADGLSKLVLRIRRPDANPIQLTLTEGGGKLEQHPADGWVDRRGVVWRFFVYTPRESFGGGPSSERPTSLFHPTAQPTKRLEDVLEVEDLLIVGRSGRRDRSGRTVLSGGPRELRGLIARPPVVLVHGLASGAMSCWLQTHEKGQSFAALLEMSGLMPFLVNYQRSNGLFTDARDSSFASNSRVVWDSPDAWSPIADALGWYNRPQEPVDWQRDRNPLALSEFQRVVALRHGGIKQALEHYRDELKLAATQADVIGHSMGGLLARVYAARSDYRRSENLGEGDIRRLITICTPHHGSELFGVKDALLGAVVGEESWGAWARRFLHAGLLAYFLEPESGAMRDLRAESEIRPENRDRRSALRSIGATPVPSFAITTSIRTEQLGLHPYDAGPLNHWLYTGLGFVFFNNRALLDAFIDRRAKQWREAGDQQKHSDADGRTPDPDGLIGLPGDVVSWDSDAQVTAYKDMAGAALDMAAWHWAMRREGAAREALRARVAETKRLPFGFTDSGLDSAGDPPDVGGDGSDSAFDAMLSAARRDIGKGLIGGDLAELERSAKEMSIPVEVVAFLRQLIFHGDPANDGAVRVVSQKGGLARATQHFEGISHLRACQHYEVIRQAIDLLKWQDDRFDRRGFPAAGQRMPSYLPAVTWVDSTVRGEEAIRWSGLVPDHARAFGRVADAQDVIIMVRPVNHDSTPLIAAGAATKGMAVKGKSATWGPQAGFICEEQRFSKLWRIYADDPGTRAKKIIKFNKQTQEMLDHARYPASGPRKDLIGRPFAVRRPLELPIKNPTYAVMIVKRDPKKKADSEKDIFLKRKSDGVLFSPWNADVNGQVAYDPSRDPVPAKIDDALAAKLIPMIVMADGLSRKDPPPYLTADYDLLAIGWKEPSLGSGTPAEVQSLDAHELFGVITSRQRGLLNALNAEVAATGYEASDVSHHGPENQWDGSEYVDYPILILDPGVPRDNQTEYILIRQGPVGFRDVHLKRYFHGRIQMGYNLYPNRKAVGWLWERGRGYTPERGFDPADAHDLHDYIQEQPRPTRRGARSGGAGGDTAIETFEPQKLEPEVLTKQFKAARDGDALAMRRLAMHYFDIDGDVYDEDLALQYLRSAAAHDDPEALALMGGRLLSEQPEGSDLGRPLHMLARADAMGSPSAVYALGMSHHHGWDLPKDPQKALHNFRKAAERGHPQGTGMLGRLYMNGWGVRKDSRRARLLLEQAVAAGDASSYAPLAELFAKPAHGMVNAAKSLAAMRAGAKAGDGPAMLLLGRAYETGFGMPKNRTKALRYYEQAEKELTTGANAALAVFLYNTPGGPKDPDRVIGLLLVASRDPEAHATYAQAHLDGIGVEKDPVYFLELIEEGIKRKEAPSLFTMGVAQLLGSGGIPKDLKRAHTWLLAAAERGHVAAMHELGALLAEGGKGLRADKKASHHWTEKSAWLRDEGSALNLAGFYADGTVVKRNPVEAMAWFMLATRWGLDFKPQWIKKLERSMSRTQLAKARQRSSELEARAANNWR